MRLLALATGTYLHFLQMQVANVTRAAIDTLLAQYACLGVPTTTDFQGNLLTFISR
jgi:hypothetical protein